MTMTKPKSAPGFWESFANALKLSAVNRRGWSVVPWLFIACIAGVLVAYKFVFEDHIELNAGKSTTILSALAGVEGLFGALSIFAMTQIQEMCSRYPFSDYLRDRGLFDIYIFTPQWILLVQLCALMLNMVGIVLVLSTSAMELRNLIVIINIGLAFYVFFKTWSLVDAIRTLVWHYADYDKEFQEAMARRRRQDTKQL